MLSGVKFIPRDQVDKAEDGNSDVKRTKSRGRKEKHRRKKKSPSYGSSDDDLDRIKKGSRKNNKWYSSDEYSSSESEGSSEQDEKKDGSRKKRRNDYMDEKRSRSKKKFKIGRKYYSFEEYSSSDSEDERQKGSRKYKKKKSKARQGQEDIADDNLADYGGGSSIKEKEIVRKEMGLEWMLRPAERTDRRPAVTVNSQPDKPPAEETPKVNPRELNPYLKDDGSGYPDEDGKKAGGDHLLASSLIGDGGASWRLKALKRAQEQAAREGRRLEEVAEERWGSLGQLAVSAASHRAAPSRAHLHAIKNRKKGLNEEHQTAAENQTERDIDKKSGRDYLRDVSLRHPEMRAPKARDSLSWGKRRSQNMSTQDADVISAAVSGLNKFTDDGSFMCEFNHKESKDAGSSVGSDSNGKGNVESEAVSSSTNTLSESTALVDVGLSANKLAAKAMQLRLKGKHEEADKLLKEAENMKTKQGAGDNSTELEGNFSRYVIHDISVRKNDDDADLHLAQKIIRSKQSSISGRADDEYDFEDGPSRKTRKKKGGNDNKGSERAMVKHILTQQERCLFCFENPNRPRHLVVALANFTYLMLPQWQPVVPGHCCILTMQHESSTRTVDNNVWDEIRNFKKCLIMMFAKQEKEVVFLETVMGLAQQRRHCLIECIPLPEKIAKQAPLYFKKAIDEAEDEWSQHNAKKLIDTSVKGLRGSIPKDFPYFHVEFGLNKGFVHVIDDEKQFKSSLGLNVIRGMLQLPEEDMYRRRKHESVEAQKQAVTDFARDWEPFDWTKQLD
ncbi:hypothetical protein Pint_24660 [Pistacia integerrima]|uniref:Uncharacterized protein n=1 Tax=Pistacia integerrima TaxID=434235 RepID=A0ACC0YAC3_9ROSI|nr:hypothetical protein Pint_24660 [Pistacia integerrima]